MTADFWKSILTNQYHHKAYSVCAFVSNVCAGVYIIKPFDRVGEWQKRATMRAHYHRVRAERALNNVTP